MSPVPLLLDQSCHNVILIVLKMLSCYPSKVAFLVSMGHKCNILSFVLDRYNFSTPLWKQASLCWPPISLQHFRLQDPVPPAHIEVLHTDTGQTLPVLVVFSHLLRDEILRHDLSGGMRCRECLETWHRENCQTATQQKRCLLTSVRACSVVSFGWSLCRASSVVFWASSLRFKTKEDCWCRRIFNRSLEETTDMIVVELFIFILIQC